MRKNIYKIKKWFCKVFGHKFDLVEKIMFDIQLDALNADKLCPKIKCLRCERIFTKYNYNKIFKRKEE